MPHVLVAGKIHDDGMAVLRAAEGITVEAVEDVSTASYAPLVGRADALLIRTQPMPASVVERAGRLRIVSRHGVGYDAVDLAALNRRGIPLAIIGDVNSVSVAEHTMMLMLAVAHGTAAYDAATRRGEWSYRNTFDAREIHGKSILVVGFGRIGRAVAKLSAAFGMSVLVHDPFVDGAAVAQEGFRPVADLRSALASADVVTVHVPLVGREPLLGAGELALLHKDAIVINAARGGLVDEAALFEALSLGKLRGAGLDVFASEPPRADDPLLSCERAVLSPHAAGLTRECAARMAIAAARNIVDFFDGRLDPSLIVNRDAIGVNRQGAVPARARRPAN